MSYIDNFLSNGYSKIWQGGGSIDKDEISKSIQYGIKGGLNVIDTAEIYGDGKSELSIGKSIQNRHDVYISTKVSPENLEYDNVIKSCDQSLKRLNIEYIDLYSIHWNNPVVLLEETLDAFKSLKESGKIKHIGICNFTYDQIIECYDILDGNLDAIQMEYNLSNRYCEKDIIPFCEQNGILFASYSPLNKGNLNFEDGILNDLSIKYNKTIAQIILMWVTHKKNIMAIVKSSNLNHIDENIGCINSKLHSFDYELMSSNFATTTIKVLPSKMEFDGSVYKTIDEAVENRFDLYPSPQELSRELKISKTLSKPVYVEMNNDKFKLVGGNVRYWAWVLAFGYDTEIDCIVN